MNTLSDQIAEHIIAGHFVSLLEWHDAETDLPDDETTVYVRAGDGEYGLACRVREHWRCGVTGRLLASGVTDWAHLPVHPQDERVALTDTAR